MISEFFGRPDRLPEERRFGFRSVQSRFKIMFSRSCFWKLNCGRFGSSRSFEEAGFFAEILGKNLSENLGLRWILTGPFLIIKLFRVLADSAAPIDLRTIFHCHVISTNSPILLFEARASRPSGSWTGLSTWVVEIWKIRKILLRMPVHD